MSRLRHKIINPRLRALHNAVLRRVNAAVASSWQGSRHPSEHDEIQREFDAACRAYENALIDVENAISGRA